MVAAWSVGGIWAACCERELEPCPLEVTRHLLGLFLGGRLEECAGSIWAVAT